MLKELGRGIPSPKEELKIIAYAPLEEQGIISIHKRSASQEEFTEIIYSKHNCEVLDRRIEKTFLEEEKRLLQIFEREKRFMRFVIVYLVSINLYYIGEFNLAMILASAGYGLYTLYKLYQKKEDYIFYSSIVRFIKELKEGSVQFTEEEEALLDEERKKFYELDHAVSIGNVAMVCNPKVLKKRFGEK